MFFHYDLCNDFLDAFNVFHDHGHATLTHVYVYIQGVSPLTTIIMISWVNPNDLDNFLLSLDRFQTIRISA